jgi:hypothetical protein
MIYDPEQVKHTLSTILHTQGEADAAEILDSARAEIVYVGEDFSTDIYRLDLRIPAVRFALIDRIAKDVQRIEEKIQDKLWKLGIDPEGSVLNKVRVVPELSVGPGAASIALPTATDENRIWRRNRLRLFLSHVSRVKVEASSLKAALRPFGIDAFVAHEDIEPNADWRRDVEFGLRSMHALCALITPDFRASEWCDQEAGYALGRAVPVLSVGWGEAPYGLIGKQQAIKGNLSAPEESAEIIFDVLIKQPTLVTVLTEGLMRALVLAPTPESARTSIKRLVINDKYLTKEQVLRLVKAARDDSMVRDAPNVSRQIDGIARRAGVTLPPAKVAAEFDDDIPF